MNEIQGGTAGMRKRREERVSDVSMASDRKICVFSQLKRMYGQRVKGLLRRDLRQKGFLCSKQETG